MATPWLTSSTSQVSLAAPVLPFTSMLVSVVLLSANGCLLAFNLQGLTSAACKHRGSEGKSGVCILQLLRSIALKDEMQ